VIGFYPFKKGAKGDKVINLNVIRKERMCSAGDEIGDFPGGLKEGGMKILQAHVWEEGEKAQFQESSRKNLKEYLPVYV